VTVSVETITARPGRAREANGAPLAPDPGSRATRGPVPDDGQVARLPHLSALDGLRGLAVIAVLFFHGGFRWARGGWLGVSIFFTLSGFLITNLLVGEWGNHGRIVLGNFWSRRFRRLLPASLVTLAGVLLFGLFVATNDQLHHLRVDVLACLGYVANWRFVLEGKSYADLFSDPSPVQHFWSLAVEEQFYVLYPLVVYGLLRVGGRRLLGATLAVAAGASALWAFHLRANLDRVYYGTDTRMAELLAGGLLALWWSARASRRGAPATTAGRVAVGTIGVAALLGSIALWPAVGQTSRWVTHGVLPLQAILSVAIIAVAVRPGIVGRLLSWRPLVAVGLVSYGLYLYHWPVFLLVTHQRTGLSQTPLFACRVVIVAGLAALSYELLEQPIRRRRVLTGSAVIPVAACALAAVLVTDVVVTRHIPPSTIAYANFKLGSGAPTIDRASLAAGPRATVTDPTTVPPPAATAPVPSAATAPVRSGATAPVPSGATAPVPSGATAPVPPVAPPRTIMIIGDSATYDAAPAIGAAFEQLGTSTVVDASFPGFGLTRNPPGWHRDWSKLIAQYRPAVVISMQGGWDLGYLHDRGEAAYQAVLDDTLGVLTAQGAHVLWLGMLPGGHADPAQIDPVFQRFAARHPGVVTYADPGPAVQAPDGTYPRWIPDETGTLILARKPDGWHVCPDGAARLARLTAGDAAAADWSPPPVDGWQTGLWRMTKRYDDPHGGCDVNLAQNAPPPGSHP